MGNNTGLGGLIWASYGHDVNLRDGFGLSEFVMVTAGMSVG